MLMIPKGEMNMFRRVFSLIMICAMVLAAAFVPAAAETAEEPAEGMNRVIFYWFSDGANYDKCDMWIWFPNADGRGYLFEPCDYGVRVMLDVPESVEKVGYIVRKDCSEPGGTSWGSATKDVDADRYAEITGRVTEVYLKPGDSHQYLSKDGGQTLYEEKTFQLAGITTMNEIQYFINPAARIESLDQVKVTSDGREVKIEKLSSLNNNVITGKIILAEELDLTKEYTV